jgi:quercetin dioxygenase-like cupin family protein
MPSAAIMTSSNPLPSTPDAAAPTPAPPCVVRPHRDATILWVLGTRVRFLVNGCDTGGRFSMQEMYTPAFDPGPPLHSHSDADEMFYILDGALKMTVEGAPCVAHAGDTLLIPRDTLHTFANPFLTPARFLVQLSPAGFEQFFESIGVPPVSATDVLTVPQAAPPAQQQLRELAIKHHMRVPGLTE